MKTLAIDCETFPFGEQDDGTFEVIPAMICTSWAFRTEAGIETRLVSDGDGDAMREQWREWLEGHDLLVFHNASFDLGVAARTYPELEPLIWAKLERGEATDTLLREKLLNLSTHGNLDFLDLPDGSKEKLDYKLSGLAQSYLGLDMTEDKNSEESVRVQYHLYSGTPAEHYPVEASRYAKQDAHVTLSIFEAQAGRVRTAHGYGSLSTEFFQTAASFSLFLITQKGMRIDRERFLELQGEVEEKLSEYHLAPVIRAGILRPAEPARPHVRQITKATEIIEQEGWDVPRTDEGAVDWDCLHEDFRFALEELGVKFTKPKKASVNRKVLCERIEKVYERIGTKPKLTDSGGICADSEVISDLVSFDEPLEAHAADEALPDDHPRRMSPLQSYQYRQGLQKLVTTELPRMLWGPEGEEVPAERVHFCFNALLATGRTASYASSHYPSGNGQQIDPRARPCYLPEEDHWLLSTDYSALELCSTAQTTYELFGTSRHREKINAGQDLHAFLGGALCARLPSPFKGDPANLDRNYELFQKLKVDDPDMFGRWRKFAKPVGLGFPGGLGPMTFIGLAKKTYKVDIVQAAQDIPLESLPGPENSTVAWHAKNMGVTAENWEWTPLLRGVALAVALKGIWLETYPEMVAYFEWVVQQHDPHNRHIDDEGQEQHALCYTTPLGMHRANGTYTAVANGRAMQAPSAEGAKAAVFRLMKECRIGRLRGRAHFHDFVHDEVVLSVPADEAGAAEVIAVVEEVMVDSMSNVMPDVRISVESALSTRWLKGAEPVRSRESGLLVPWDCGIEPEPDDEGNLWIPSLAT